MLKPFAPDLVLTAGYLYLLIEPDARGVQPPDPQPALRRPARCGRPTARPGFPGIRAVRDALAAGCAETRATVHLVDDAVDAGPPLVRSWPFPVSPMVDDAQRWTATDVLRAYTPSRTSSG